MSILFLDNSAGCRRSWVRRAEWQVPGRESVADRPNAVIGSVKLTTSKLPFSGRRCVEVEDGTRTACLGHCRGHGAHPEHTAQVGSSGFISPLLGGASCAAPPSETYRSPASGRSVGGRPLSVPRFGR